MQNLAKFFILPECYIAFNAKVASSSLARMIIRDCYPELESKIQNAAYPVGKGANDVQWQGFCPRTDAPENKPILLFVRDPIERFKSAIAQFNGIDVDEVLNALNVGGYINFTRMDNHCIRIYPQNNIHFTLQSKFIIPNCVIKLYKFPEHLDDLIVDAGLSLSLVTINQAKHEKPVLTTEQESKVLAYYANDKILFDSILSPGMII